MKKPILPKKERENLPPLDLRTETKLRAFANMIIDRIIEDRANGYYSGKHGVRWKCRISENKVNSL